jgi:hypothetical protein
VGGLFCVGGLRTAGGWDAEWLGAEATLLRMPSLLFLIRREPGICCGSEAVGFCAGGLWVTDSRRLGC